MKCEDCLDVIEEYFDKELSALKSIDVAAHLVACPSCAEVHEALKQEQIAYTSYKRDIDVTPALWQGIQERIKQEAVQPLVVQETSVESVGLLARLRKLFAETMHAPRFSPALAAALVIVAVGATVMVMNYLNSRNNPGPVAITNTNVAQPGGENKPTNENANQQKDSVPELANDKVPSPVDGQKDAPQKPKEREQVEIKPVKATAEDANRVPPSARQQYLAKSGDTADKLVRDAEQKYLAAITLLKRDYNKRRTQLDPQFVAKMDAALSTIDNTIAETRKAVKQNPDDPIALQYMLAAYAKKVEVLKGVSGS
jgi:hypothetical protein